MKRVAIFTVLVVLLVLNHTEAQNGSRQRNDVRQHIGSRLRTDERQQTGLRLGKGQGRGISRCTNETKAVVQPCWTGHVSCPANSVIQVESVNCSDRCTRGRPGVCADTTLQTRIETNCNGLRECFVKGVSGTICSALKTVVYVQWACAIPITVV